MLLEVEGRTYTLHFSYEKDEQERMVTQCVLHDGKCAAPKCWQRVPLGATIGLARCSRRDQFSKAKGRQIALARTIAGHVPRDQRAALWQAYFKVSPHR